MSTSGQSDSKDAKKKQPQPVLNIGGDVKGNIIVGNDNEIRKMKKTERAVPVSGQAKPKKEYGCQFSAGITIAVAVISCIGAVTAAGVEPFATWFLNRTPVPTSTDISTTSTPAVGMTDPVVDTQEVACTFNQNCPVGVDWTNACIAEYNWTIYSSSDFPEVPSDELGCYSQPILDVFYTKVDGLYIFAQPTALTSSKDYGLFTPLPQSGNVSITLDLDRIDNGQVWFGVFERTDAHSAGVLLVAPPGDVRSQAFALKTMPTERRVEVSRVFQNSEGKYTVGFELEYGSVIANVEGISMTPMPFTPRTRWLFIGYRAKLDNPIDGTADIQALFSDLKIE